MSAEAFDTAHLVKLMQLLVSRLKRALGAKIRTAYNLYVSLLCVEQGATLCSLQAETATVH